MRSGEIVSQRYRVEALIGQGGFGSVYRALDLEHGIGVALKVLHGELGVGVAAQRFEREAAIARQLVHPHTVRLLDAGEHDGQRFLVFELLRGESLRDHLRRYGRLSGARCAAISAQVLQALIAAHALGIVHRDIKPSNIFLCDGGDVVRVLDFGIAKPVQNQVTALTDTGVTLGSPAYMSPEQARGAEVTARSDLYSLGITMAQMLAGEAPYRGGAMDVLLGHLSPEPVPLPPVVTESPLAPVIRAATQKDPALRPGSAAEMLHVLRTPGALTSGSTAPPDRLARESRHGWILVIGACATAVALMGAGVAASFYFASATSGAASAPLERPPGFSHSEIQQRLLDAGWSLSSDSQQDESYYKSSNFIVSGKEQRANLTVDFHRTPPKHRPQAGVGRYTWAASGTVSVRVSASHEDNPLAAEVERRLVTVVLGPKPDTVLVVQP
jgi:serine/threonine protein kinase